MANLCANFQATTGPRETDPQGVVLEIFSPEQNQTWESIRMVVIET